MGDRRRTSNKVSLGLLKGKPMSTSVPTFRFHAGGDEIEQIYPEIEEEPPEKGPPNDGKTDTLSVIPPVAPPRTPKHGRTQHRPNSGEVSPVHASLSTGSLNKRSTSMDTGIVDAPGHNSGWGLFTDIRGKIVRTVEEIKNDRQARHETSRAPVTSQKDNTSFSDSEDASSSESNQPPSYNLSTSDSVSQLSGVSGTSSLSTTPTTPSAMSVQKSGGPVTKWHSKFLPDRQHDEDKVKISRPATPVKVEDEKCTAKCQRAGSVPLVHESMPASPHKRCTSLRSRLRPKLSELRNRRKKVCVDSRSNSSLSSALYSADGNETDDDVESGVEALEEAWEDVPHVSQLPSTPLGDAVSKLKKEEDVSPDSFLKVISYHKYSLLFAILVGVQMMLAHPSLICHILIGGALVLAIQEEVYSLFGPSSDVSSMHMRNQPFAVPNYCALPTLQAPVARELISTDNFQGWMNELNGTYDTKTYHISMTESVYVRIDGACLTLSHARTKVSKRAMWNEPPIRKVIFTDERIFDLRGWQVKLLPEGITRRRQWSKKYPICLLKRGDSDSTFQENLPLDERVARNPDEKETNKVKLPLSTAKYAKNSTSTDSLEMLLLSLDSTSKDCSKDSTSVEKQNLNDNASDEDDDSFCIISSDMASQNCIFLFARADREKEEWYRRFAEAVRETEVHSVPTSPVQISSPSVHPSADTSYTPEMAILTMAEYLRYMQHFHLEHKIFPPRKKMKTVDRDEKKDKEKEKDREKDKDRDHDGESVDSLVVAQEEKAAEMGMPMSWLNALVGRVCFDVLRSPLWKDRILLRLQKKLSTLKLPYFMETLTITELDMGNTVPLFHRASQPTLDMRGLWVELDVTYQGSFRMTIESKLNLMKLKRNVVEDVSIGSCSVASVPVPEVSSTSTDLNSSRSPVFDSDLDDTAESSSDDDTSSINLEDGSHRTTASTTGKKAGKKLLRMVDKIAASKYFQQATEMKYIKKAMEGVSNTRIMLSVELKGLVGTLALNLPPPPSDRLWYGFHGNPKLWLSAHPTLGERQVNFTHISNWIEQKLCQEFQKVLVLPNMDDLVIPVMSPQMPV